MSSILDLSGADTSGFDALDAGSYPCNVFEIEMGEASGQGKLPAGVPSVNVQFIISADHPDAGRRFFNRWYLPTLDQHEKAAQMQGNFVRFLVALGEDEKKIKSKGFDPDNLENLIGRACVVRVGKELYKNPNTDEETWTNPVKAVKPEGSPTGTAPTTDSKLL